MIDQERALTLAAWLRFPALGVVHWFVLGTALTPGLAVVADEGNRTLTLQ